MNAAQRTAVALACAPAWFAGVLTTTLVGTISLALSGFSVAEVWNGAMLLFFFTMLMTVPVLIWLGLLALVFAPWVISRPIVFLILTGLLVPGFFVFDLFGAENRIDALLLTLPAIVVAACIFRYTLGVELDAKASREQPNGP